MLVDGLILYSVPTGLDVNRVRICSLTFSIPLVGLMLLVLSSIFELSIKEFVDVDERGSGGGDDEAVMCVRGLFNCKFNEYGLLSLIKLRGSCIVVSSLILSGVCVGGTLAISVKYEDVETLTDGTGGEDVDVSSCFVEQLSVSLDDVDT